LITASIDPGNNTKHLLSRMLFVAINPYDIAVHQPVLSGIDIEC
jgi:hypothetical protein